MLNPSDIPQPLPWHDEPEDRQVSEFAAYVVRWMDITCAAIVTISVVALIFAWTM